MNKLSFIEMQELMTKLSKRKVPTFLTIYTLTDVEATGKYKGRVRKYQAHNVQINFNYKNAVNKQRVSEGKKADFTPDKPRWAYKTINGTPFVSYRKAGDIVDSIYLRTRIIKSAQPEYLLDGKPVLDIPELDNILGHTNAPYSNSGKQAIAKEVVVRNFKLQNIRAISYNGMYVVEG